MAQTTGHPLAKLLLAKLAEHANDNGVCHPSKELIAHDTEMAPSSVYKYLKLLNERKLAIPVEIEKTDQRTGRRYKVQGYQLAVSNLRSDPPRGNQSSSGQKYTPPRGRQFPRGRNANNEPSFEPSLKAVAFVAPLLTQRVEQLRREMGSHFDAYFQEARFEEEGPTIVVRSEMIRDWVNGKYIHLVHSALGPTCSVIAAEADLPTSD